MVKNYPHQVITTYTAVCICDGVVLNLN